MTEKYSLIPQAYIKVLKQLSLLLLISQVIRFIFFIINHDYFSVGSVAGYLQIVFYSIRFDLSSIFTVNIPYIIFALLPFAFISHRWVQKFLQVLFVVTNSVAFIFDIADIGYFPYVRKRMTADVFDLIGKKSDFADLLPNYLTKFWYVSLLIILLLCLLVFVFRKFFRKVTVQHFSVKNLCLYLAFVAMSVIAIRGGLQLRPIVLSNAVLTDKNENIPLIINTPFSILKTLESKPLAELHYFKDNELDHYFDPVKKYGNNLPFKKQNVIVIILESFGKAFTGIGGRESYTPFLDSLMNEGMTFDFAFANAFRSADGIPAILSGIPFFMNDAFPLSPYATNKIDALPSLLRQKGYSSSFFHGGTNGTMNFDTYSKSAGFDQYYGRKEYGNEENYDGTWGIWDEPFLQFFAQKLNEQKQPFFSTVFTLSSHEPFAIPKEYKNAPFAQLTGIKKGISYTDMALRKFFQTVSRLPWYKNTLFVLVADHHYLAYNDAQGYYNQGMGLFSIPVLFYHPEDAALKGANHHLMQQIDIMPSVLDYLHFDKPFFSLGKSVFDTATSSFCYASINNQNYMLFPPWLLTANFDQVNGNYNFSTDSLIKNNLIANKDSIFLLNEKRYHAFLQLLHSSILKNKQSVSTYYKNR